MCIRDRGEGIRVELRSPDTSANPYVVLAICLAAGLDGIKNKITPTKSSNLETKGQQAEHLPSTLKEAIDYFEESSWVKEVLGEEFCDQYITCLLYTSWIRTFFFPADVSISTQPSWQIGRYS